MAESILKLIGLQDRIFVLLLVFIAGNAVIQAALGNNIAAFVHVTGLVFFIGGRLSAITQLIDEMEKNNEEGPTSADADE